MREKLKLAIHGWHGYLMSCQARGTDATQLRLVLAAARAYACSECAGTGMKSTCMPIGDDHETICQACKADRELADKGSDND